MNQRRVMREAKRIISAGLLVTVTACTSVRPLRTAPEPFISAKRPNVVYLVDKQGRLFTVASPRIQGDSVVGLSPRMNSAVGLPLSSVGTIAAAQPDHTRTALLIVALAAGAGGFGYALSHTGGGQACVVAGGSDGKVQESAC